MINKKVLVFFLMVSPLIMFCQNSDYMYLNIFLGKYEWKIGCGSNWNCTDNYMRSYVDSVPYLNESDLPKIEIENEYGDVEEKFVCYGLMKYEYILSDKEDINEFLNKKLKDVCIRNSHDDSITIVSIKVVGYLNSRFIHKLDLTVSDTYERRIKSYINNSVIEEGGYLKFKIKIKFNGITKYIEFGVKIIGVSENEVYREYLNYLNQDKIIRKENYPDCLEPR